MFKINHYVITIVALFCSLGIGILMGMTMGEDVLVKQQEEIIDRLEQHFEMVTEEKQDLLEENKSLKNEIDEIKHTQEVMVSTYNDLIAEQEVYILMRDESSLLESKLRSIGIDDLEMLPLNDNFKLDDDVLTVNSTEIVVIIGSNEDEKNR
ncbi:copper transporter [Natranaerobius trueperi]|uniref:Copper transporter n=1 Tax=Natranaerobius trueperi TaxID=759412 RepID=A0A226BYC7_9FIRM|nr:copper transporter [Natranaerobius trueperi]OWZ84006.1 hypothetical protein CDO51_05450 [Natranaerobius trueperi]